jgi:hypothetical protein
MAPVETSRAPKRGAKDARKFAPVVVVAGVVAMVVVAAAAAVSGRFKAHASVSMPKVKRWCWTVLQAPIRQL